MPRQHSARDDENEPSSKATNWFWAVLVERARQLLEELRGDDWSCRSSADDARRAAILARREVLADSDAKIPPRFLREHCAGVTERTLRRLRRYLTTCGFNSHVAGRIAQSDVARRLATMPTLIRSFDSVANLDLSVVATDRRRLCSSVLRGLGHTARISLTRGKRP